METFTAVGSGFQVTVPADTSAKTLNLYAEVLFGQGQLQASLSDGSAAAISDQSVIDADVASKVYSIDFRAASAGQTLTVTFTSLSAAGGVALQAATLTPHLPVVAIAAPGPGQTFPAPATIALNAGATQFDSSVTDVQATGSDGSILQASSSTLTAPWGPLPGGHYSITATATDSAGLTNTSAPVETDVIGQGGTLSIQRSDVSSPVDLTVQGTADWVLWGPFDGGDTITDSPGDVLARMTGVAPLISNYQPIGNHFINPVIFANNLAFTNGSNTLAAAGVGAQLQVFGQDDGYQITVPADTTQRTLQLYASAVSARGKLTAFLSDGSAAVAADNSFDDPNGPDANGFSATTAYSISYSAASAGQTLTLRYTLGHDYGSGQVGLIGTALSGTPATPTVPVPQISAISPPTSPVNTQVTITGTNFGSNQGTSSVSFGGLSPQIVTWSDTRITVWVPTGLSDGRTVQVAVVTAGGTSNEVNFVIPAFQIFPSSLSLVVGQSATVRTKDSQGNPVTGLGWSTSDPTIVTLSKDDPPLITALAVGSATVYAGDVLLPVTVYPGPSLPQGTLVLSLPLSPRATSAFILPAIPSGSGVDVLAYDNFGVLSAFTTDGELLWSVLPIASALKQIVPDFSGNVFLLNAVGTSSFDPNFRSTGGAETSADTHTVGLLNTKDGTLQILYTFAGQLTDEHSANGIKFYTDLGGQAIPSPAGVLFVHDVPRVKVFDIATTNLIANIDLDQSSVTVINNDPKCLRNSFSMTRDPVSGPMVVAGDGNAYVGYSYETESDNFGVALGECTANPTRSHIVTNLMVLRVSPDGSYAKIPLQQYTYDSTCTTDQPPPNCSVSGIYYGQELSEDNFSKSSVTIPLPAITNADQGAAVTWQAPECTGNGGPQPNCVSSEQAGTNMTLIIQDSAGSTVSIPYGFQPTLQRADGSYIGTDTHNNLMAVGLGGAPFWTTAISPDANGHATPVNPLYAPADGSTIVTSTQPGSNQLGTLYTVDQNGNLIGQTPDAGLTTDWNGDWWASSPAGKYALSPINWEASFLPHVDGSPSRVKVSSRHSQEVTVIGWIDKNAIVFPTGSVSFTLNHALNESATVCAATLVAWTTGRRTFISSDTDRQYANAFLLANSSNREPPQNLDDSVLQQGDWRVFGRAQASIDVARQKIIGAKFLNPVAQTGRTPDACSSFFVGIGNSATSGALEASQAHPDNGTKDVTPNHLHAYQINEGRVGFGGQSVHRTLNACTTIVAGFCTNSASDATPWVWSVTSFGLHGEYTINHQIFPTYSLYADRKFIAKFPQAPQENFIQLNSSNSQIRAVDIQ